MAYNLGLGCVFAEAGHHSALPAIVWPPVEDRRSEHWWSCQAHGPAGRGYRGRGRPRNLLRSGRSGVSELRGFGCRRQPGLGMARRSRSVLRDQLRAVREVLRRLPRVLSRVVPLPLHQVVSPAPAREGLAVEKLLHHTLALLALVGDWAGWVWFVRAGMVALEVGLETLHVDGLAAQEAAWEGHWQGVGIRAGQGDDPKGTLPPRSQLANLRCVKQLSRP